jgi:hypothetical protein
MFYAPEERHEALERALQPLRRVTFDLDPLGSRIVFYNPHCSPGAARDPFTPSDRMPTVPRRSAPA